MKFWVVHQRKNHDPFSSVIKAKSAQRAEKIVKNFPGSPTVLKVTVFKELAQ